MTNLLEEINKGQLCIITKLSFDVSPTGPYPNFFFKDLRIDIIRCEFTGVTIKPLLFILYLL